MVARLYLGTTNTWVVQTHQTYHMIYQFLLASLKKMLKENNKYII